MDADAQSYVAFVGNNLLANGSLPVVLRATHEQLGADTRVLIFEDATGRQVDFDLRGSIDEVLARVAPPPPRVGPGRPRLGVVAREISLLPRHWEWLEQQPNGASAALRRLVDEARNRDPERQRARMATEAAHRFMTAMAGDQPGYEAAMRALYAGDRAGFMRVIGSWPTDIVRQLERMTTEAFVGG